VPRAVIDTNVVLAACYGRRAWQSPLLTAWLAGRFDWVTSEILLAEFLEVSARPEQRARIRAGVASSLEQLLRLRADFVIPLAESECPPCRDPDDVMVLATAVAGEADYLVTTDGDFLNDPALLVSMTERGLRIVRPFDFFASLKSW